MSDLVVLIIMSVLWSVKHIDKVCYGVFFGDGF